MWSAWNRTVPRIGRHEIWTALLQRRQKARASVGGLTILAGAEGIGKTTFLEALVEDSRAAGFRVATARASPVEHPAPFTLISDALVPLRALRAPARPEAGPAPGEGPSSIAFLPALDREPVSLTAADPLRATEEGGRSEQASDRFRLMTSLAEPFLRAARSLPLLVALDDLQWSDEASLELLLFLLPQIDHLPIWIAATADLSRARRANPGTPLARLGPHPGVDRVELRPFDAAEVAEFAQWAAPHRARR